MSRYWKHALLGTTALAGLALASGAAQAQVQSPGFFGSATGWYYFDSGNDKDNLLPTFPGVSAAPDKAWGGRAYLGYRLSSPWDIALGVNRSWFTKGKSSGGGFSERADADVWAGDGEIGYNIPSSSNLGWRVFAGARWAQFDHDDDETTTGSSRHVRFRGIGPRIGTDFAWRFSDASPFSLVGGASGSALFGHVRDTDNFAGGLSARDSRTVWNADGQLGLDWEFAQQTHLTLGYRAEWWSNVGDSSSADKYAGSDAKNDRFMHGPFVRLAYNIGAPRAVPVAATTAAPPPPPVAQSTGSYMVFFDFDRSNLTPQAQATVKQAADAAKAGNKTRLNVTGHTDTSGSDQYNMALSLRRANAVKDELVRDGVAANAIVILGKGESQPLVPTGDGVKEAQNRRVEIVLQ